MKTLAERLRRALQDSGLKKGELADRTGLSRSAISQLTKGESKTMEAENLVRAAEVLGVELDVALLGRVLCLLFVVAACRVLAGTAFDRLAISFLTLLGLAVGVQELTGVLAARAEGYEFSYDMALIHFAHPRSYNQLQSWTVPVIALLPLVFPRQRLAALLCVAALGLHWYILLMTGARGSTAGLVLAFLVVFVVSPAARKPLLKWQSAGLILGLFIYAAIYLSSGSGVGPAIDTSPWTGKPAPGSVQGALARPHGREGPDQSVVDVRASRILDAVDELQGPLHVPGGGREKPLREGRDAVVEIDEREPVGAAEVVEDEPGGLFRLADLGPGSCSPSCRGRGRCPCPRPSLRRRRSAARPGA